MLKIYKKWNFVYKACKWHICGEGLYKKRRELQDLLLTLIKENSSILIFVKN